MEVIEGQENDPKESKMDELFDQFIKLILNLDQILKHEGVDDSNRLKNDISPLRAELSQREKKYKDIDKEVTEIITLSSFMDKSEDLEILKRAMKKKRHEQWKKIGEGEELGAKPRSN